MYNRYMQLLPERYYHLFVPAENRTPLFAHRDDYHAFLRQYRTLILPVADTFAYCLLPNHLHLLVRIKTLREQVEGWYDGNDLEVFEPLVAAAQFTQLLGNLQAVELLSKVDRLHLIRYIHRNPLRHEIGDFRDYIWSSYKVMGQKRPTFIARDRVLRWFHGHEWFEEAHWEAADLPRIGYLIAQD